MTKKSLLLKDLENASSKLKEALTLPEIEINRDGTIQRFEFTFELTWKLLNLLVREKGIEVYGHKNTLREAAMLGFITGVEKWFTFLDARNLTTHVYKKEIVETVYKTAGEFAVKVEELLDILLI